MQIRLHSALCHRRQIHLDCINGLPCLLTSGCVGTNWRSEGGRRVKLEYLFPRLSSDGPSTGSSCFPLLKATGPIKPHSSYCSLSLALRVGNSSLLLLSPGYHPVSCEFLHSTHTFINNLFYEILPTVLNLSMSSVSCPDLN